MEEEIATKQRIMENMRASFESWVNSQDSERIKSVGKELLYEAFKEGYETCEDDMVCSTEYYMPE